MVATVFININVTAASMTTCASVIGALRKCPVCLSALYIYTLDVMMLSYDLHW